MVNVSDELVQRVYQQLREDARRLMASDSPQTLRPTEVVHEAWARVQAKDFQSEKHFKAVASLAMVHVLADHARAKGAAKRQGVHVTLSAAEGRYLDLDAVALHEALGKLHSLDARSWRVVTLRYFGGLSIEEVAEFIGVSARTVQMDWRTARVWLMEQLTGPV